MCLCATKWTYLKEFKGKTFDLCICGWIWMKLYSIIQIKKASLILLKSRVTYVIQARFCLSVDLNHASLVMQVTANSTETEIEADWLCVSGLHNGVNFLTDFVSDLFASVCAWGKVIWKVQKNPFFSKERFFCSLPFLDVLSWMYLSFPFCTPRVALSEMGEFLLRLVPVDKILFWNHKYRHVNTLLKSTENYNMERDFFRCSFVF